VTSHRSRFRLAAAISAVALSCSLWVPQAHATLGSDVASVDADQHALGATRQIVKLASGERHELTLPSGMVIREFVSARGQVYAVTWTGPRMPDLRALLGPYFPQLSARTPHGGHHRVSFHGPDLVVQSSGHGQSFSGRAWVPSLLPAGFGVDAALDEGAGR
jgi:Protein of unknown function (DUF2844)